MSRRPRIGVTGPLGRGHTAFLFTRLALARAGAKIKRLTVRHPRDETRLDALIIGGGDDIDPARYGGKEDVTIRLDKERDAFEWEMLERANARGLPVLGICRGAQLLNVYHGGTLHQELTAVIAGLVLNRTVLPRKTVQVYPETRLARILEKPQVKVNSLHRQGVNKLAEGFRISARDDDGIVQAIESTSDRFMLGVQWHPEYLPQRIAQRRIFSALTAAARGMTMKQAIQRAVKDEPRQ